MVEHFDAGGGSGEDPTALLARLGRDVSTSRIDALLDELGEVVAEQAEKDAGEPLDPGVVAQLQAVTGAEDAPLTFASLHRRVEQGMTTWEQFWADPRQEADGLRIMTAALKAATAESASVVPDDENVDPALPPRPGTRRDHEGDPGSGSGR